MWLFVVMPQAYTSFIDHLNQLKFSNRNSIVDASAPEESEGISIAVEPYRASASDSNFRLTVETLSSATALV